MNGFRMNIAPDRDKIPATLVPSSDVTKKCNLCHRGHIHDPLGAGKLYKIAGSCVHFFCMLFSEDSEQIGGKIFCQATGTWDLGPGTWDLGNKNREYPQSQEMTVKSHGPPPTPQLLPMKEHSHNKVPLVRMS